MAPSPHAITSALQSATEDIFKGSDRDALTVNLVRKNVENNLGLEVGFLVNETWKDKSKKIIKDHVEQLIRDEENGIATTPAPVETKKGVKRSSPDEKPQPKKRQKKEVPSSKEVVEEDSEESDAPKRKKSKSKPAAPAKRQPKKKAKNVDDSEELDEEDDDESLSDISSFEEDKTDEPKPKKARAKTQAKGKRQPKSSEEVKSDLEDEGSDSGNVSKKLKQTSISPERRRKPQMESISDSDDEDSNDDYTKNKPHTSPKASKHTAPKPYRKEDSKAQDSDSSSTSIILDEAPTKSKRGSKNKSTSKSSKPAPKELSPAEQQIKTLQSQLVKCGVRKIWGIELKRYGDDSTGKIRHLQQMLRDVGMVGRFSEARAREIKEMRELQADLEAVTQGESMWGVDAERESGGRPRRKAVRERKTMKIQDSDEEDDGDEDIDPKLKDEDDGEDDEDEDIKGGPGRLNIERAARAKQDLAFLGDDESDSD